MARALIELWQLTTHIHKNQELYTLQSASASSILYINLCAEFCPEQNCLSGDFPSAKLLARMQ